MARPPLDPVEHLPAEDAYRVSARDMLILRDALRYKARAEMLEQEIVSLRQIIDRQAGQIESALDYLLDPDYALPLDSINLAIDVLTENR